MGTGRPLVVIRSWGRLSPGGNPRSIRPSRARSARGSRMTPRGRVVAIVNQKGGVGKTTTAVNLSASFAASERATLLVDIDPQANASSAFGIHAPERQLYDALMGQCVMKELCVSTELPSPENHGALLSSSVLLQARNSQIPIRHIEQSLTGSANYWWKK